MLFDLGNWSEKMCIFFFLSCDTHDFETVLLICGVNDNWKDVLKLEGKKWKKNEEEKQVAISDILESLLQLFLFTRFTDALLLTNTIGSRSLPVTHLRERENCKVWKPYIWFLRMMMRLSDWGFRASIPHKLYVLQHRCRPSQGILF